MRDEPAAAPDVVCAPSESQLPRSRPEAKERGLKYFFTGKPCCRGHISKRFTASHGCLECNRENAQGWRKEHPDKKRELAEGWYKKKNCERLRRRARERYRETLDARRESARKWAANNPERVKENGKKYRAANRERYRENNRKWRANNPKIDRESDKRWRKNNREKIRAASRKWYAENSGRHNENAKKWRAGNPDKCSTYKHNRRARIVGTGGTHSVHEIEGLLITQQFKCAETTCRASIKIEYHKDHIMPLVLGGSNHISNIQLLCPKCNLRKSAKHPIAWANENGRLL